MPISACPWRCCKGVACFKMHGELPVWQCQSHTSVRGRKEISLQGCGSCICSEDVHKLFFPGLRLRFPEIPHLSSLPLLCNVNVTRTASLEKKSPAAFYSALRVRKRAWFQFQQHRNSSGIPELALTSPVHNTTSPARILQTLVKPQFPIRLPVQRRLTINSPWSSLQGQRQ